MDMIGRVISHYRITAKLGEGGMGEVYRAEDVRLGRSVALKLLTLEATPEASGAGLALETWDASLKAASPSDPSQGAGESKHGPSRQRFLREARAVSALNHPGIVTVYDVGESEGRLFIVMELVAGETIRMRLDRGNLELKQLLRMASTVAEALAKAHAAGIVHRDIKPENIMLTGEGQTKLLDFGIAKLKRPVEGPGGAGLAETAKTMPGTILGTIQYMSPEQILGQEVDHRSDLFSLGAVLYECLAKRQPFQGAVVDIMHGIVHAAPQPIRELNQQAPEELDRIVQKLMEKDPEERFQSAADLTVDLRRIERRLTSPSGVRTATSASEAGLPVLAAPRPRRFWAALAGALAAGVALGVLLTLALYRPPQRAQIFPVTHSRKKIVHPALSPDGRLLVFVSQDQVYAALAAGGETTQLTRSPGGKAFPRFSPDGARILFTAFANNPNGELWEISALGGAPRRVLADAAYGVWSPDGSRLAFLRMRSNQTAQELHLGDARGANSRKLAEAPGQPPVYIAWTPDSHRLIYLEAYLTFRPPALRTVSIEDETKTSAKTLVTEDLIGAPPIVSSDGRWVYYSAAKNDIVNLWRVRTEGGRPEQVTFSAGEDHSPSLSPDGQIYFVHARYRSLLHLFDAQGSRRIADEPLTSSARLSPDGKRVVFVRPARSGINIGEMFLINADGTSFQHVDTPGSVSDPLWSRDGRRIAFSSRASGRVRVHVLELETERHWEAPGPPDSDTFVSAFSTAGELLLDRWRLLAGLEETVIHNLSTGQERLVAQNFHPIGWSADGKWVGLASQDVSKPDAGLFLIPVAGGPPQRILTGVAFSNRFRDDSFWFHPSRPEIIVATRMEPPQFVLMPINDGRTGPGRPWFSRAMLRAFAEFGSQAIADFQTEGDRGLALVNEADMDIFHMRAPQ